MKEAVCNASPLIVLAKAQLLDILPKLFDRILVPQAVGKEIAVGPENDPLRQVIPGCDWLTVVQLEPPLSPLSIWAIDPGEAEVIEYARTHGPIPVILDDLRARRVALRLGLDVYGTLGLVAASAGKGNVLQFRSHVEALKSAGLYVSNEIIAAVEKGLATE